MLNINYYIGEVFLSVVLFLQLIYGSIVIRRISKNYCDIKSDLLVQCVIILLFLISIYFLLFYNVY